MRLGLMEEKLALAHILREFEIVRGTDVRLWLSQIRDKIIAGKGFGAGRHDDADSSIRAGQACAEEINDLPKSF